MAVPVLALSVGLSTFREARHAPGGVWDVSGFAEALSPTYDHVYDHVYD